MPNHITNHLIINDKENLEKIKNFLKSTDFLEDDEDTMFIDFNKIVKMPKELNIESGSLGEIGYSIINKSNLAYCSFENTVERFYDLNIDRRIEALKLGIQYYENKIKYGFQTWYEWSIENWGTKWNAYSQKMISENCISFQTAWEDVRKLIVELSKKFVDTEFIYKFSSEDTAQYCASMKIKNGIIYDLYEPKQDSKEAYEFHFELIPDDKDYYELINGKYEIIDMYESIEK